MAYVPSNNLEAVEALYIGYFGRAGEPGGVDYWVSRMSGPNALTFAQVAASFSVQPEAKEQHPFLANPNGDPKAFVSSLYSQLLNRADAQVSDATGFNYWVSKLASATGSLDVGLVIAQFISGAQGVDIITIQNKVASAVYFTAEAKEANVSGIDASGKVTSLIDQIATEVINGVTGDPATIVVSKAETDAFFANGTIPGTSGGSGSGSGGGSGPAGGGGGGGGGGTGGSGNPADPNEVLLYRNGAQINDFGNISDALAQAQDGDVIYIGAGTYNESLEIDTRVELRGEAGVKLYGQVSGYSSAITLLDGADGSTIADIEIHATVGGSAVTTPYNPSAPISNVSFLGNTFNGDANTGSPVVYLNPGVDGWVIRDNIFIGNSLTVSPLLGIEGNGHLVENNNFLSVPSNYASVESFSASTVFEGNSGLSGAGAVVFREAHGTNYNLLNTYDLNVVQLNGLPGGVTRDVGFVAVDITEVAGGRILPVGDPVSALDGRESSIHIAGNVNDDAAEVYFDLSTPLRLNEIDLLQYDFFVRSSDRTDIAPNLALSVDGDGNLATTADQYYLIFEWAYAGQGQAPVGSWTTFDLTASSAVAWMAHGGYGYIGNQNAGPNTPGSPFQSLSNWANGVDLSSYPGGVATEGTDIVFGLTAFYGTYNGQLDAYVDNIVIGSAAVRDEAWLYVA